MEDPKVTIYNALKDITANVYQIRPEKLNVMPVIVFEVDINEPEYALDSDIARQVYRISIDIFAKTSTSSAQLQNEVESAMRAINYVCLQSRTIPDPENYSHLNLIFVY